MLQEYRRKGAYTDCFATNVAQSYTHARYVEAFYTTWVFKLERVILKFAISRPSTDGEARELAQRKRETFAAWSVEGRAVNQVLMRDEFTGRTRSWLMSESIPSGTRLYFGSAVVPRRDGTLPRRFSLLLGLHRLYSRILLGAARRRIHSISQDRQ